MLLRILFLSSCCSLGLSRHPPTHHHSDEESSGYGITHYNESSFSEEGSTESSEDAPSWSHAGRAGPGSFPTGLPWPATSDYLEPNPTRHPSMSAHDGMKCDMIMNGHIYPPLYEIPFYCICSYCKGSVGPKGERGDQGLPGSPGSIGMRGLMGMKGRQGFTGPPGIKGQKGDFGMKGQPGSTGSMGSKGQRGFKGEKGDQGLMGVQGEQGPQGETGTCPAECESIPGAPGPQGTPGPVGGRGLPGIQGPIGVKGMKGVKGDLGRPGDQGMMGDKGDQGEQGVCECADGMDGNDGPPGVKGDKGDKGDTGAQGVRGPMGMKGDLGLMGPMGVPGLCAPAIQSAFSASLTQSFPRSNWPVAFKNVFLNRQEHFNANMGIYTAPVNGTFIFSFHLSVAVKPLKVGLFRNYQPVFKITEVQNPSTTSGEVVLHLSMNDQVWLQVKTNQTNGMYAGGESTSTFSGYLLHPDSCEMPLIRDFAPPVTPPNSGYSWDGFTTPSPN